MSTESLVFGYIRLLEDVSDADLDRIEDEFSLFARIEGFTLSDIFYENDAGGQVAFAGLIKKLKREDAHHVLVPTYDHLSRHIALRVLMQGQLDASADAFVHVLCASPSSDLPADPRWSS